MNEYRRIDDREHMTRSSTDVRLAERSNRWALWRFNRQNITPQLKLEYALLEVDGAATPSVGWWLFGGALIWVVLENLL